MTHQKHAKLTKPSGGKYGRNELAILGAPCGEIKELVTKISTELATKYEIAYLEADHHASETEDWTALKYGAIAQYTNKISRFVTETKNENPPYFNSADLVLINGNHFNGEQQVVWVHPKKSLEKKLDKLTNVSLIIIEEGESVPQFIHDKLGKNSCPIINSSDLESILQHISVSIESKKPKLNGLVLVGGKSTRMQQDKSQLVINNGEPQFAYLANLLNNACEKVFVSVRDEAQGEQYNEAFITDKFIGLGPYGGILSAFQHDPNAAWLVVAVDLPFLDSNTINTLIDRRNTSKAATCFIDRFNEFPEPLITIWEPRAYRVLLEFLSKGYSCPRKALINSDVELITDRDSKVLTNVNNPEELAEVLQQINA